MQDKYGREIDYLRVSLTDRCSLRCVYCMPEEGVECISHEKILRYEEIIRLISIVAPEGISKIKLTGGEPLARKNLAHLITELYNISGIKSVTMTTNAIGLKERLGDLYSAGLRSVNISLDALDRELYHKMTRADRLESVLESISKALEYPDIRLKINTVPIKGQNEDQLARLVNFGAENNIPVRFIELMPIGFGREMECLDEQAVREILYPTTGKLTPINEKLGHGPSQYWQSEKLGSTIGFISAVSHAFCDSCNRVRLTADGFLKTCLQYDFGVSLRDLLRNGATDEEILAAFKAALDEKPREHEFSNKEKSRHIDNRTMWQTGG